MDADNERLLLSVRLANCWLSVHLERPFFLPAISLTEPIKISTLFSCIRPLKFRWKRPLFIERTLISSYCDAGQFRFSKSLSNCTVSVHFRRPVFTSWMSKSSPPGGTRNYMGPTGGRRFNWKEIRKGTLDHKRLLFVLMEANKTLGAASNIIRCTDSFAIGRQTAVLLLTQVQRRRFGRLPRPMIY